MVNNELKKLSRRDLIDIIYQMKKNEQKMEEEIASLKNELEDRRIRISNAGSLAEAAVSVSDVFATAQKAADVYLEEISNIKEDAEKESKKIIDEAKETASKVLAEGKKQYLVLQERYKEDYAKWQELKVQLDTLKKD